MKLIAELKAYRSTSNLGTQLTTQPQHSRSLGLMALTLVALTGCLPTQQAQAPSVALGNPAAENALRNPTPQDFPKPIVSEVALGNPTVTNANVPPLATVPVKGLIQTTRPDDRTQQMTPNLGRDPFAGSPSAELQLPGLTTLAPQKFSRPVSVVYKPAKPTSAPIRSQKPSIASATPQIPRTRSIPRPIVAPSNSLPVPVQNNFPLAPISLPSLPIPSPTALADQVEITGVVQVGDRVMAIAKAPEESSARYVTKGDRLSGGRVIVREIRTSGSPVVILEQNGQKVMKSIGANRLASAR